MNKLKIVFETKDDVLAAVMLVLFFPVLILLLTLIGG